jgi:hypothetical protein
MMKKLIILANIALLAGFLTSCGVKHEGKNDPPAGSPDELKDSTRLDAAPDTTHKAEQPDTK